MPRLTTHGDADAECSLYVYSHCSCCFHYLLLWGSPSVNDR